jgi:triacylglycerol esterase/lipase EstA (alpha/beta hydrolase family)
VILVNGTFANQDDNWQAAAPLLANHGYCVFTFNYGGPSVSSIVQSTGDIRTSARQLGSFVTRVLAATGAAKVDLVGHSQGGMMPRYYLRFLGGAKHVAKLVALAPSNHGTTLSGLTALVNTLGRVFGARLVHGALNPLCTACVQQEKGSRFLAQLNTGGATVAGVSYTVIETRFDQVVTPYTSTFLSGPRVTNIVLQNQCKLDRSDHLEIAADPVALADVLNALDPAHPVRVPCLTVLPITGPVGPVPSF